MRKYSVASQPILSAVVCNCCGKEIPMVQDGMREDSFHGEKTWGYLSEQDGRQDNFDVCQDCYEKWTSSFAIKVNESEKND